MLSGSERFSGEDPFKVASAGRIGDPPAPRSLNPQISLQAEEIVLRALRRNPAERYATAAAMREDLDRPGNVALFSGIRDKLTPVTAWRRRLPLPRYVTSISRLPLAPPLPLLL